MRQDTIRRLGLTAAVGLALGLGSCGEEGEEPAAAPAGTIRGVVRFRGAYTPARISMAADPNCAALHDGPVEDDVVIRDANGGLANAVVSVRDAPAAPPPEEPAVLEQRGCRFRPRVIAIVAGQHLEMRNADRSNHNVSVVSLSEITRRFHRGVDTDNPSFRPEGPFPIRCNVHPWMTAVLFVFPHDAFAVTAPGGAFELNGLAPGAHTLVIWHETLGERVREVTVAAGGVTNVNVEF